ncbi:DUF4173 domain-containing protein [Micromonospora soli]|uniref:DUF4153 domain-containing protein n=1 Tax=Micromonospora sp. NBRC 110009 TaxID=3061627 RepID=UPI0026736106|nr:DUF4173 domain-containing protein [Micromonospora sp. NBRC 110009]WKU01097.1 DUF4173 domain-containing protein [Micromonospora sp. NBRC 110009]
MTTAHPPQPPIDPRLALAHPTGLHPQHAPQFVARPAPLPSAWERRWPGAVGAARPVVLGTVAVAAGVGASVVPLDRPGLGWLVATVAGAAALGTAGSPPVGVPEESSTTAGAEPAVRPGATGAPGRAARLAWAVATVALVGVGTVRAAGWLFALCLIAALGTASLAVAGGRTPLGLLAAGVLPPIASLRALPWAARGLPRPRHGGPSIGRLLASLGVTAVLLLLFGLLFSSADAVFADLVAEALPDVSTPGAFGWIFRLLLVGAVLLGGAYLLAAPPDLELRAGPARAVRRLEWVLPLALLDALFAAFVLVQLTVLFGGSGHVLHTAGLTYAEYARGGFWQLLAVSALTLLVIAGAMRWAPRRTGADRALIRLLIGGLTVLSLVIVASALYRMRVYTEAYGATRLRLGVATVELWLGLLFVLVGVATVRLRGAWLPRLVLGAGVVALLGLAVVNPDRLIADWNVTRWQRIDRLDVGYLSGLSADAAPALDQLPEPLRSCALREIAAQLPEDGWRAANVGRARARAVLDADRGAAATTVPCP